MGPTLLVGDDQITKVTEDVLSEEVSTRKKEEEREGSVFQVPQLGVRIVWAVLSASIHFFRDVSDEPNCIGNQKDREDEEELCSRFREVHGVIITLFTVSV